MLLDAQNIVVSFKKENQTKLFGRERQEILHGISLQIDEGECMGLIGESGSGKSTFGRVMSGLLAPDSGKVLVNGHDLYARRPDAATREAVRHAISIVFQDYTTSANPRFRVRHILGEAFRARRMAGDRISSEAEYKEACELLERVGLSGAYMDRYPHELSGGQLQRVCIARAVAIRPKILLLDEAISSLDAVTQIQVMDLLKDMQNDRGLSYLFITHDLMTITYFCDRVRFLHNGSIVESVDDISTIGSISNPYARDLLQAVTGMGITVDTESPLEERAVLDEEAGAFHGETPHGAERVAF